MGQVEAPSSWKIVRLVFLRKPDAVPKKGIRSFRATALTSVVSKRYAACINHRLEKKNLRAGKKLHVGRNSWDKQPASASYDDISATQALGMAGGKDSHAEAWQCGAPNNVFGMHGHQVRVR